MPAHDDLPRIRGDALAVLLTLSDRPLHGYGIMLEAEARSGGEVRLQTGALYRTLKRLLEDRLIEECERPAGLPVEDERRRYYRLSPRGRQALSAEGERLARLVHDIRLATGGEGGAP
jgi:DNA-binding PadR family transcriptional regulator